MAGLENADSPKVEPCLSCGEETAVGSVFFSDRYEGVGPDGKEFFVCAECLERLKQFDREGRFVDMSDPDVYLAITAAVQFSMRHGSI
jgi:hypothetical protein